MATAGIMPGKLMRVYVGSTAVSKATECNISFSAETREASHKDSAGWKETLPGSKSCTITTTGLHAEDSTFNFEDLWTSYNSDSTVTVRFSTEVNGDIYYEGSFTITSLEMNAPDGENTTFSATFESNGAITKAAVS